MITSAIILAATFDPSSLYILNRKSRREISGEGQSNYFFSVILLERLLEHNDFSCFLMQSNHELKNKNVEKPL